MQNHHSENNLPAKSTSLKQSHGNHLVRKWASNSLFSLEGKNDLLAGYAHYLCNKYEIPLEAGYLISIGAVTAATGSARKLEAFVTMAPALNITLVSDTTTGLRLAVEEAFQPLVRTARRVIADRRFLTPQMIKERKLALMEKYSEVHRLEDQYELERSPWVAKYGRNFESEHAKFFENNPQDFQKTGLDALKLRNETDRENVRLEFEERPGFLLEGISPTELVESQALSADRSVFNLDIYGNTWSALVAERPSVSRRIALELSMNWRGAPYLRNGEFVPSATISSLSVLGLPEFNRLWNCHGEADNLIRTILLVADAGFSASIAIPKAEIPADIQSRFSKLLLTLLNFRHSDRDVAVALSPEAQEVVLEFLSDVKLAEKQPQHYDRDVVRSVMFHALRFALILHLGANKTEAKEVTAETMRRGCHLSLWCAAGALHILDQLHHSPVSGEDNIEQEVLIMAARVRQKGPLKKRELFRTFHDQRSSKHLPILEEALSRGVLVETDDGTLRLPGPENLE